MINSLPQSASRIPVSRRLLTFGVVLIGYILYCYNFVVIDYVRPYLISELHFSIRQTAIISSAGTVGITIGALCWAEIIARLGRRRAAAAIAAAIGAAAAVQAASGLFVTWAGARLLLAAALGGYYVVATGLVVALFPAEARGKLIAVNSAMYPTSNILVAAVGSAVGDAHWHVLLWLGALPLPLALVLWLVIPRDERYRAFDDTGPTQVSGSWREMLSGRWLWLTLGCVALSGIDFNAYQLFFSFVTLYMKQVREASAGTMGLVIAVISAGSLVGTFAWAVVADRFGRRLPGAGYLLSGAAILVFLYGGLSSYALVAPGFAFGFGLSCTTAWGVWFAEMFPLNLRPYGVALFQAGHILAIGAPLLAAFASERLGLVEAMSIAPLIYVAGAALWARLPETLGRPPPVERPSRG